MVFRNDIESVFPKAWFRFIAAARLTQLCNSFHIVSDTTLDTITDEDGIVTSARLKSGSGETIFFTARTCYNDLLELRGDVIERIAA